MFKKLLVLLMAFVAAAAFAAVDVNKATQAELETVKGIGPAISTKIISERTKAPFKDWTDMVDRVKGVGEKNAATFSSEGLTVNGETFKGVAAAPAAAAASKASKVKAPAATAVPAAPATAAAPATPAAADAGMSAADKKAAAKQAKEDKKAAAQKAKDDKKAAKAAAAAAKASEAAAAKK